MKKLLSAIDAGSEHQELQVAAVASTSQFQLSTSSSFNRYSTSEQLDGTMVADALPHAAGLSVT